MKDYVDKGGDSIWGGFCVGAKVVAREYIMSKVMEGGMKAIGATAKAAGLTPDKMKEALGNVVKNAIEYSPEGKTVEIRIEHTPLVTRIFVKDEGEGIPKAERTKVFERFYRINGNTINPSSVGIGLALAKKITAGCGGRLYVNSRHRSECKGAEQPFTTMIFDFHNEVTSLE